MTYDAFDYEAAICEIFPGHGAIMGGRGPILTRDDFNKYPFDELPNILENLQTTFRCNQGSTSGWHESLWRLRIWYI